VLRLREAHPKRSRTKSPAYIAMVLSPKGQSFGNLNQSRTPAAEHFACRIVNLPNAPMGQLDESAQHILATSADVFKSFQSLAAIDASEARGALR
jgi:hypothetical protein